MHDRCLIVIPTYNEKENIRHLIEALLKVDERVDLLVVDDSSPDGTAQTVRDKFSNEQRVSLIVREGKLGLGSAYVEGFRQAMRRGYGFVMEMDADFSHKPEYVPDFLEAIRQNDLVIGSRYINGGGVVNWGAKRRILSRGGSLYSSLILGAPYRDLTGGFKCFRTKALEEIDLSRIKSNGYAFQIELTYLFHLAGKKIREIPIIFEDRTAGQSKLSRSEVIKAVFLVPRLKLLGKRHPGLHKRAPA